MRPSRPFVLVLLAVAAPAIAQGWAQRFPALVPPGRTGHCLAFDIWRGVHVLFGGGNGAAFGDTWEWNGTTWTPVSTLNSPSPRVGPAMAYDFTRGRVVLFGGHAASVVARDTWEFDGVDWVQRFPMLSPPARHLSAMAYSSARCSMIVFGGASNSQLQPLQDSWEWNGTDWIQLTPAHAPSPRHTFAMTSDFGRGRVVLAGGLDNYSTLSDAWVFDGVDWTPLPAAWQQPSPRSNSALAADHGRGVLVQFGGATFAVAYYVINETWLYDGSAWRLDPRPIAIPPRRAMALSYDWVRDKVVSFGGAGQGGVYLSDTWEYSLAGVAQWAMIGAGCAGTQGVPQLRHAGPQRAILGTSFGLTVTGGVTGGALFGLGFSSTNWNGNALPLSLASYGMPGCLLHTSLEAPSFAPGAGGIAFYVLSIPNSPGLVGVRFFTQALVPQAGANAAGAVMSDAMTHVIGSY